MEKYDTILTYPLLSPWQLKCLTSRFCLPRNSCYFFLFWECGLKGGAATRVNPMSSVLPIRLSGMALYVRTPLRPLAAWCRLSFLILVFGESNEKKYLGDHSRPGLGNQEE